MFIFIIAAIWGGLFWICNMLSILGIVTYDCECFAVDSAGKLYLGIRDDVIVYENGQPVREMPAVTNRAYAFTILEDDTMLWSTGSKVYITDLYGANISEAEDENASVYNSLKGNKSFKNADGSIYYKDNAWGQLRIFRGENVVYEHPVFNQLVLFIEIVSILAFIACVFLMFQAKKGESR